LAANLKTLRIEAFKKEHLDEVQAIEKVCQSAPWSEASFRNELDSPQSIFLVALMGGKPVGYGGAWILADEAHITTLAVHPDHRREGLARRLMDAILEEAVKRDAVCSTLEVRAGNTGAIQLYEAMGYVQAGVRKGYYPDNREDAVIMWKHDLS
jgi:ribosomal-protein-alanine N-acetyltransferase